MTSLLDKVKAAGEDFEWYPTTRAMLEVVAKDLCLEFDTFSSGKGRSFSILDIGSGNGNALKNICELTQNPGEKYAIEKSVTLIDSMPEDVFVIGTDFHQQTLIDKKVDVVFCNPPYSEFDAWMTRIVSEANCRLIYMVVPQRWKENGAVVAMINKRCDIRQVEDDPDWDETVRKAVQRERGRCQVLESTTFEDSEFRQARAKVDILKIKFRDKGFHNSDLSIDPFDLWFDSTFSINAEKVETSQYATEKGKANQIHQLVEGQNIIERLNELYHRDFDQLLETYRALEKLDYSLFKELGVNLGQAKGGLKSKISGLKNLYWKELFNNLDAITDRLTSKSREKLLGKLTAHTSVDFTADNAYAVVLWAIKNANKYFDEQLREVFKEISDQENIRNYKSNHVLVDGLGWRYTRGEHSRYTLDYRLVLNRFCCFNPQSYGDYDYPKKLHKGTHDILNDLCTIGVNLGFKVETRSMDFFWSPGEKQEFLMEDGTLFMDVKAFKKGTIHIRMNQKFMEKFNIEAGRLNGWVNSPKEAAEETGIQNAGEYYGGNFKLKSVPLLESRVSPEPVGIENGQFQMF